MFFPMLPYMVGDLGVATEDVGFIVGLLGTCFSVIQIPSNILWGKASDHYGRRPIMVFGQCSLAAFTIMVRIVYAWPAT